MQKSSGWLARIATKVRALFVRDIEPATPSEAAAPSVVDRAETRVDTTVIEPVAARPPVARMLAARIACQSKLNVPAGKKPRSARMVSAKTATRRPKKADDVKKVTKARSVYLPARHLAAQSRPKSKSNVITLPVANVTALKARAPVAKAPVVRASVIKLQRLAA
jgi:hypothetical protein